MENGGNTSSSRIHNGSWDIWQYNCNGGTCRNILLTPTAAETASTTAQRPAGGAGHALPFPTHNSEHYFDPHHRQQRNSIYGGGGEEGPRHRYYPDPHLMCLELGKRQYHLDDSNYSCSVIDRPVHVEGFSININGKRGKPYGHCYGGNSGGSFSTAPSSSTAVAIPRCQVEGCNAWLAAAKDYHRRHKVCEMHSKAPKVVVLGLEQRFCQQCSRFHGVSEFDDAKRSCRRRLAGHNERRRKSSHEAISKNYSQGCAFSLLSSKSVSWDSPADLSSRSSAALRELIAEHRAATLGRQRILEQNLHHHHVIEHLGDQCQPAAGSSFFLPPPPASNV